MLVPDQLTAQTRGGLNGRQLVEHRLLVIARRMQPLGPIGRDMHMAGSASAGAPAHGLDGQAMLADYLHDAPAFHAFEHVRVAGGVVDFDVAHCRRFPLLMNMPPAAAPVGWRRGGSPAGTARGRWARDRMDFYVSAIYVRK